MKNNDIISTLFSCALLAISATSCNNAEYDTLGTHAYISESAANKNTKVTIADSGIDTEITVCLSDVLSQDAKFKLVVDSDVLDKYNQKQAASFVVLPDDVYVLPSEVIVKAGNFSASATKIHIKPLPEKYLGESYALPLRLESVDGVVPTTSATATYVIMTESIMSSSLPVFTGAPSLTVEGFSMSLPQFTIETRFQISNTQRRNRFVFTNESSVLLRFEDPQNDTDKHKKHSLVQFQGQGWYLNPSYSFEPNKWQHLAMTYDGKVATLYVNGAFAGSKEGKIAPEFKSLAWFGGTMKSYETEPYEWRMCKILCTEMRLWSVCRTEAQIQNNMTITSAKSQGLEAYWRMNEGSGTVFKDITGNGHTLTTKRNPVWIHNVKSTDTETLWP